MAQSGRAKSMKNPYGIRRTVGGKELAPRSLRKKGKSFLSECSENELRKAEIFEG